MQHLTIANQWISSLLHAFALQGLDTAQITHRLKGFRDNQVQPGARIELSDARMMWHRAVQQSDDPLLGLKVGMTQDDRSVGVLAPIIWHSPTVREALSNIQRYQKLISESGQYQQSESAEDRQARYLYIPSTAHTPAHPQQILAVIIGTIGGVQNISHGKVRPLKIEVPQCINADLLSAALACPVEHSDQHFSIHFPLDHFDSPLSGCDPHLYEINKTYAESLLRAKNEGLALIEQVKFFVRENGGASASIDALELDMQLNKRTIQRYLKGQGTNFREVKEEALKALSIEYLMQEKLKPTEIARRLNYSEVSAFHRAFRQWFGVSPKQFGRQL